MNNRFPTSSMSVCSYTTALARDLVNSQFCSPVIALIALLIFSLTACSPKGVSLNSSPADVLEDALAELHPSPELVATELVFTSSVVGDIDERHQTESIHRLVINTEPERLRIAVETDYYRLVPIRFHINSEQSQALVDNKENLRYASSSRHFGSVRSSTVNKDSARKLRRVWSGYEFINGYMPTRGLHIAEMLAVTTNIEWVTVPANSGGSDDTAKMVLRAESDYGVFTFWFEKANGTHPTRITRDVSGTDMLINKPVNIVPIQHPIERGWTPKYPQEALKRVVFTINYDDFMNIGGRYIPMSGDYREDRTYSSGKKLTFSRSIERTSHELNPQFTDDDFALDVPDGTRVSVEGSGGINHVWEDGGIRLMTREEKLVGNHLNTPVLGVKTEPLDDGVRIVEVMPGSGAQAADLHEGDLITHLNGIVVGSNGQIVAVIREKHSGDVVSLNITRDDQTMDVSVTLGIRP